MKSEARNNEPPACIMSQQAPKPKGVATYTRMSENRPLLSPSSQMAMIRKYAKQRGLKIVRNYSDGAKGGGKA
jgi:hypothetical protein